MKRLLFVTLSLCVALLLQAAKFNNFVELNVANEARKYLLYVPSNVKENAPLVLSLHGAGGTVTTTTHDPNFHPVADAEGFIVAYPQGLPTAFPGLGGMTANGWSAYGEDNFDTEFLLAVIESVASKYSIDRKRIYCCGFSNGGMMTYTMANTNSHVFAAFAAISGYPINEFHLHHTSWRPVPLLHIHGKNDDFVKYSLVPNIIDNMVARNGANPVPVKTTVSDKYSKSIYEAGEGGFPVVFYEIDGMGHEAFTNKTEDGSSSKTMWNFFKQYTLDAPCDITLKWRPRIETDGYAPKSHGWTMNSGTTLLRFGGTTKSDANQNVYRSLQFRTGKYKLCFKSQGEEGKTITVRLQKTGKSTYIINTTVNVGEDVVLPFEVTDGWGEYKLTLLRPTASDVITITDIAIRSQEVATVTMSNPGKLVSIPLAQEDQEAGMVTLATSEAGDGYTQYTTKGDACVIFKMKNVDVTGCDNITFQFAEPTPSGLKYAFWTNNKNMDLPAGVTEFRYVFAEDTGCEIAGGIVPEVSLLTLWSAGKVVKVKGVYKHQLFEGINSRTYSFDKALDFTDVEGLQAYVITAFNPATATLTLTKVTKVPANTGLYLVGQGGDYNVPVIDSAAPIAVNLLHASSGTVALAKTEGEYTNLVLGGTEGDRGFHPLTTAGVIGDNKAYLQLPTDQFNSIPAGARLNLVIDDSTTAVTRVVETKTADNAWYTLSGMKLEAKPSRKGIYINNGKKFAVR